MINDIMHMFKNRTNVSYKPTYTKSHLSTLLNLLNKTNSLNYNDINSIVIYLLAYWSSQSNARITWESISYTICYPTKTAFSAKLDK